MVLAVALLVGWITDSFYTGLTVAVILLVATFVATGLLVGAVEWRVARSFAAPRGRVATEREVMEKGWPILLVLHEPGAPAGWRFLHGEDDLAGTEFISVHIQQILEHDPSVAAVAQLPPGWRAWRSSEDDQWETAPTETATVEGHS